MAKASIHSELYIKVQQGRSCDDVKLETFLDFCFVLTCKKIFSHRQDLNLESLGRDYALNQLSSTEYSKMHVITVYRTHLKHNNLAQVKNLKNILAVLMKTNLVNISSYY